MNRYRSISTNKSHKQREIVTINCGGYGVNIGQQMLQQFATEHGISSSASKECKTQYDSTIPILFNETKEGSYIARGLFTDLDCHSINNIKTRYTHNSLLNAEYLINGKHDACFNFAMGQHSLGKQLIGNVNDAIRKLVESTDNCQGFLLSHSLSGGTGGGLTALILDNICNNYNYNKKIKFGMNVIFDENRASSLQVYTSLLSLHSLLEYIDVDIIFDNTACDNLCKKLLDIKRPTFKNYNNLLTKLIGDVTATTRFGLNDTLQSIYMDMVGFPRIKWLTSSIWPLIPKNKSNKNYKIFHNDIQTLTNQCLNSKHFIIDAPWFAVDEDKTNVVSFCCRGENIEQFMSQANYSMDFMLSNRKINFMEHSSQKPMLKFVDGRAAQLVSDDMFVTDEQISMVMNNMWISRLFEQRVVKKYDKLYGQKLYLHHFLSQGMEESQFAKARDDVGWLEKDYLDLYTGMLSESEEDEDDDY